MGFSDAEEQKADQEFILEAKDYSTDIEFKYVKFQRVDRITVPPSSITIDIHRRESWSS